MTFRDLGINAPGGLSTTDMLVRPIVTGDAELDYQAVMESREHLRQWSQSTWPEDDFTVEANRADMVTMEERHAAGLAFGYTVMNTDQTECLGCVYVFSPDARWFSGAEVTALGDGRWLDVDAMFLFWVRTSRLADGLDRTLLDALVSWVDQEWNVASPVGREQRAIRATGGDVRRQRPAATVRDHTAGRPRPVPRLRLMVPSVDLVSIGSTHLVAENVQ